MCTEGAKACVVGVTMCTVGVNYEHCRCTNVYIMCNNVSGRCQCMLWMQHNNDCVIRSNKAVYTMSTVHNIM